jgi:hypothetical protein
MGQEDSGGVRFFLLFFSYALMFSFVYWYFLSYFLIFFLCWYELWRKQRWEKELKIGGEGRRKWRTTQQGGLRASRAPGTEDARWNINKDNNSELHL